MAAGALHETLLRRQPPTKCIQQGARDIQLEHLAQCLPMTKVPKETNEADNQNYMTAQPKANPTHSCFGQPITQKVA